MNDPYESAIADFGRYAIPIGLLLWGMATARSRSLRPGANAPALRGLMVSLGAWVVLLLHAAFAPMLPWQLELVAILAVVTLGVWASALGVIGLLKVRGVGTGLVPGVVALVIGAGLSGVMAWSTWSGYARGRDQAVQLPTPAHLGEFGLSMAPPVEWRAVDPKSVNPTARVAYVRLEPSMAFVLMADHASPGQTFEESQIVSSIRSSLQVPDTTAIAEERYSVSGRDGARLRVDNAGPDGKFNYTVWLSTSPSEAIVIMVTAKAADASSAAVASEADRVFKTLTFQ